MKLSEADALYESSKQMKRKISLLEEINFKLETSIKELNLQINAEKKRCKNLEEKIALHVYDKVELEKKLTEVECQLLETRKDLEKVSDEQQSLWKDNCDLEITIAENDVYVAALKEHLDELEGICTTLREQRDEQNGYYTQREISLKSDFDQRIDKIKREKSNLLNDCSVLKAEQLRLKDEIQHLQDTKMEWFKEKETLQNKVEAFNVHIRQLENDLMVEKETVEMLFAKNNTLASELMSFKETHPTIKSNTAHLSNDMAHQIEELVRQFYEKQKQVADTTSQARIYELLKELSETEHYLAEEKHARRSIEAKLDAMKDELMQAKTDANSLMELSVARCRKGLGDVSKLYSPKAVSIQNVSTALIDSNLSEILNSDHTSAGIGYCTPPADSGIPLADFSNSVLNVASSLKQTDVQLHSALNTAVNNRYNDKIEQANKRAIEELKKFSLI